MWIRRASFLPPALPSYSNRLCPSIWLSPACVLLSQVVAGLQPEQTNVFLQQLAEVAKQHRARNNPVQQVALACKAPHWKAPHASGFQSMAVVLSARTGADWSDPTQKAGQHRL